MAYIEIGDFPVFTDIYFDKEQGNKLLEEASECREAYENFRKAVEYYEERFGTDYESEAELIGDIQILREEFMEEAADVVQVIANTVHVVCGGKSNERFDNAVAKMIAKNRSRGRYDD